MYKLKRKSPQEEHKYKPFGFCDACPRHNRNQTRRVAATGSPNGSQMVCWPCYELLFDERLEAIAAADPWVIELTELIEKVKREDRGANELRRRPSDYLSILPKGELA